MMDDIKEELRLRLEQYYHTDAIDQKEVRYTRIGSITLECAGIADYKSLTINGGTSNIPITIGQIPVSASEDISLTEGTVT